MSSDPHKLVSTSNDVMATLAGEGQLSAAAALQVLVKSGQNLHAELRAIGDDEELWKRLREAESGASRASEWTEEMVEAVGEQHVAILELLGYKPPPPARQLVDEMVEGLLLLRQPPAIGEGRGERVDHARRALRAFDSRLEELLEAEGLAPEKRRRGLRRILARGAKLLLVLAPVAVGYAALLTAVGHGAPLGLASMIKDSTQALAESAVTGLVVRLLPESGAREPDVGAVLGRLGALTKARALARVVETALLRLDLSGGFTASASASFEAAIEAVDALVAESGGEPAGYPRAVHTFEVELDALERDPSDERLSSATDAWRNVLEIIDRMEEKAPDAMAGVEGIERERARRKVLQAEKEQTLQTTTTQKNLRAFKQANPGKRITIKPGPESDKKPAS